MRRRGSSANHGPPRGCPRGRRPAPPVRRAAHAETSRRRAAWRSQRPTAALRAARGSAALEVRRTLLNPRHLGLDYVLAAPRLVEQLLVDRPWLLVGTVVVQDAFRVTQGEGREPSDLGAPLLRAHS